MESQALDPGLPLVESLPLPTRVIAHAPPHRAPVEQKPHPEPLPPLTWDHGLRRTALSLAGMAIFGFALRTSAERAAPGLAHLTWSLAMPLTFALAWVVCLPAFYIFYASREPNLGAGQSLRAALEAIFAVGAALASTAPVLWFFAVTAPQSHILAPLGLLLTGLALIAGGAIFGSSVRRLGGQLGRGLQWIFLGLLVATFVQFASLAGIHWF